MLALLECPGPRNLQIPLVEVSKNFILIISLRSRVVLPSAQRLICKFLEPLNLEESAALALLAGNLELDEVGHANFEKK